MIDLNLEWLYRLVRQPWRIKRVAVLPVFVLAVLRERFLKGR
jgi:N-acetylglucosaminyldiphosphoundecaprenol N-acetyl-beta-D-mannosaminyltransferase